MKLNNVMFIFSLFILSLSLNGCKDETKRGVLAKTWTKALREYQIYPTFSAREDVQVGDIILMCQYKPTISKDKLPQRDGWYPMSQTIDRLDINDDLKKFYNKSILLPASPPKGESKLTSSSSMPSNESTNSLFRLRNAAFPDFLTVKLSGTDIGAAIPSGIVMAGLGVSSSDIKSASISIPSVGTYQLPINTIIQLLKNKTYGFLPLFKSDYKKNNCLNDYEEANLLVVTEAYAAYSMKINMNLSSSAAAQVKAAIKYTDGSSKQVLTNYFSELFGIKPSSSKTTDKSAANTTEKDEAVAANTTEKDEAVAANTTEKDNAVAADTTEKDNSKRVALENLLESHLRDAKTESKTGYPGVTITSYAGSLADISIDREFSNPVVIGFKAVLIKLNDKGEITGISSTFDGSEPPLPAIE